MWDNSGIQRELTRRRTERKRSWFLLGKVDGATGSLRGLGLGGRTENHRETLRNCDILQRLLRKAWSRDPQQEHGLGL